MSKLTESLHISLIEQLPDSALLIDIHDSVTLGILSRGPHGDQSGVAVTRHPD